MPKYVIKEGFFQKALTGLFKSIAQGKQNKAIDKIKNDPELVKLYKQLDKDTKALEKHLKKYRKKNPKAAEREDLWNKL
tara:strand:+ start:238 stop:474 length:237 start_codon:yes stop_codon:yes gene_type:complete